MTTEELTHLFQTDFTFAVLAATGSLRPATVRRAYAIESIRPHLLNLKQGVEKSGLSPGQFIIQYSPDATPQFKPGSEPFPPHDHTMKVVTINVDPNSELGQQLENLAESSDKSFADKLKTLMDQTPILMHKKKTSCGMPPLKLDPFTGCDGKPYTDIQLRYFMQMAEDREDYEDAATYRDELALRANENKQP